MSKANFPGISPLARETTQNYLKTQQGLKTQNKTLKFACIILFGVTCFNAMFAVMMVYKNSLVLEENLELIQENRALIAFQYQQSLLQGYFPERSYDIMVDKVKIKTPLVDTHKFARMINLHLGQGRADCPPCTTEKPTVVQPSKNPVSILNELISHRFAEYNCENHCLNPPIHFVTLNVTDPDLPEKSFSGKGESKQKSKQVAAYRALEFFLPEKLAEIAEEHKPDLIYAPTCLGYLMQINRTKC